MPIAKVVLIRENPLTLRIKDKHTRMKNMREGSGGRHTSGVGFDCLFAREGRLGALKNLA